MHIERLLEEGFRVEIGPHVDLRGFYATICKHGDGEECPECENPMPNSWEDSGHGATPEEALTNAEDVYHGGRPRDKETLNED